jgi:multiple sugar transport system substrate-binding protein
VSLQRLAPFVWQNGGELVDDPNQPTKLALDSAEAKEALQWFVDLRQKHKVVPDQIEEESEDSESRFQNGRTAMFLNSRRGVPTYREIKAFDWDVAALPRNKTAAGILHADAYFMPKSAKNKVATWAFIEFANSKEGQAIVADSGRTVPSLVEVAQSEAFLNPKKKPANSRVFLDTLKDLRAVPVNAAWAEIESTSNDEIERAFFGVVSTEEALTTLLQRTKGQLKSR